MTRTRPFLALARKQEVRQRMGAQPARRKFHADDLARVEPDAWQRKRLPRVVDDDGEAKRDEQSTKLREFELGADLAEAPATAEHEPRQQVLLARREARHVGVLEDVRAVLVEAEMRDLDADFVHPRRPFQVLREYGRSGLRVPRGRRPRDARGLRAIDPIAERELLDRRAARIAMLRAPKKIVENAQSQRAGDGLHA